MYNNMHVPTARTINMDYPQALYNDPIIEHVSVGGHRKTYMELRHSYNVKGSPIGY